VPLLRPTSARAGEGGGARRGSEQGRANDREPLHLPVAEDDEHGMVPKTMRQLEMPPLLRIRRAHRLVGAAPPRPCLASSARPYPRVAQPPWLMERGSPWGGKSRHRGRVAGQGGAAMACPSTTGGSHRLPVLTLLSLTTKFVPSNGARNVWW
jgi:hypothetical protein